MSENQDSKALLQGEDQDSNRMVEFNQMNS